MNFDEIVQRLKAYIDATGGPVPSVKRFQDYFSLPGNQVAIATRTHNPLASFGLESVPQMAPMPRTLPTAGEQEKANDPWGGRVELGMPALPLEQAMGVHRESRFNAPLRETTIPTHGGHREAQVWRPSLPRVRELLQRGSKEFPWGDFGNWYEMDPQNPGTLGRLSELPGAKGRENLALNIFGATSIQKRPSLNFELTRKVLAGLDQGKTLEEAQKAVTGMMKTHRDKIMEAGRLRHDNPVLGEAEITGPKINPYVRAHKGDKQAVVLDTWMARIYGFTDSFNESDRRAMDRMIREDAKKVGMGDRPRDFQALLWAGIKDEIETLKGGEPFRVYLERALGGPKP